MKAKRSIKSTKRITASCLILAASVSAASEGRALEPHWFAKMDTDGDGRVSREEYVRYGADYMNKRGRPADLQQIDEKFNGFDRNRDGFITDADPGSRDPIDVFLEQIQGRWSCVTNSRGVETVVFLEQGKMDIMQRGASLLEACRGRLNYRVVHPNRQPFCVEITMADGTPAERRVKCIFSLMSDDQLRIRAFVGDKETPFPEAFVLPDDPDTFILTRVRKPMTPMQEVPPEMTPAPTQEPGKEPLTFFGIPVM